MSWFALSLFSVFALATAELSQQYLLNKKNGFSAPVSLVLTVLVVAIFCFPVILFTGKLTEISLLFSNSVSLFVVLSGFLGALSTQFYFRSFQVKNISVSTIFISLSAVVSTFLGILFLGEGVGLSKFFGVFLILSAIIFLNFKNRTIEKKHLFGLVAGVIFGISYTVDNFVVASVSPVVYLFVQCLMMAFFGVLIAFNEFAASIKSSSASAYKPVVVSGFAYFLYNLATYTAYSIGGEVGRIDAINNSQVFLIILFEIFILRNSKDSLRKIICALLAISGVVILGNL